MSALRSLAAAVARWGGLALLLVSLTGCLTISVPTQSGPVCSWNSSPPANSTSLCNQTFRTLSLVLQASLTGDRGMVRRLARNSRVVRSVMRYAASVRHQGATGLHIVPSFTMIQLGHRYGAGFYILGKGPDGVVQSANTVYLRRVQGKMVIVSDQPAQDW